jgi:plastocyanin
MYKRWWVRSVWLVVLAVAASLVTAPAATSAASASVSITEQGFTPAVLVVVGVGTTVTWQNNGSDPHSLTGQVRTPGALAPGQSYQRRFTKPGEYRYADSQNPNNTGTVVVIVGSERPGRAPGSATYHYKATLNLDVNDQWKYYDPLWGTTSGPCNAQVGSGLRVEHLVVHFPDVVYERNPSIHVETLFENGVRAKFGTYTETINSKVATTTIVSCPGGGTGYAPTQSAECHHNYSGKPLKLNLAWGPTTTKDGFSWSNFGPRILPGSCGSQIIGALVLVGVKYPDVLPLDLIGYRVDYDEGLTSTALPSEVRAMRAGRAFEVVREVKLDFTTPCCEGFNPGPGGVYARVANIHHYSALLTIRFTPRG